MFIYAKVRVWKTEDNSFHEFDMKNDAELGATLNHIKGSIVHEIVSKAEAVAYNGNAWEKCKLFNILGSYLKQLENNAKALKGE